MNLIEQKEILRKSVYDSIFYGGFSNRPNGDYGKIPDFKGSDIAAQILAKTEEWKKSKTIFVSPDSAQTPVRYLALKDNKNLIMASPNLEHGNDSTHHLSVDLLVEGSVAVDREGHRIGKGKGYGDREIADLLERKLIKATTPLATTIHPLQLVDFVPTEDHDQKLNMLVTTEEIIRI